MSANLAEVLTSAVTDGAELVPWAAPNESALQWEPLEQAVLRALGGPTSPDLAVGIPLLRFANTDFAPVPLIQAVLNPPVPRASRARLVCDVSGTVMSEPNTLWVPCGASVVQVTMRNHCRSLLEDFTSGNVLVWS